MALTSSPTSAPPRPTTVRAARNPVPPPEDFEPFWLDTLGELAEIDPAPHSIASAPDTAAAVGAAFASLDGAEIQCWLSGPRRLPDAAAGRSLLVTCHGYGGFMAPERVRRLGTFDVDVIGIDARGFGRSRCAVEAISPHGYLLTGFGDPRTSILRGAVCDYIQACRAGVEWYGLPRRILFQGFSFAGGLAVMSTGAIGLHQSRRPTKPLPFSSPDILAVGAPTFGYLEKRLELCQAGSGFEMASYIRHHPEAADQVRRTLSYFDATYFAPFVGKSKAPAAVPPGRSLRVLAGVGAYDPIVPAETVYAIYNALGCTPELFEMPCSHTTQPEEREWVLWEGSWLRAARKI